MSDEIIELREIDILALIKDGTHFASKQGAYIHIINSLTGRTVCVHKELAAMTDKTPMVVKTLPDGTAIYTQANVQLSEVRETAYSLVLLDLICGEIAKGGSLTKICNGKSGMPDYETFRRWRRQHTEVDKALADARLDRAEYMRDKAMAEAEDATEDDINVRKFKHEAAKWSAGVDDGRYSPKAKVEATLSAPTQIVVMTGIDRSKDEAGGNT